MNRKVNSYLGFAKKSGNLVSGGNTCSFAMAKKKVKLMIVAEDISENSEKKIMKDIRKYNIPCIKYGRSDELSHATGCEGRNVFAVCDENFAKVIMKEIEGEINQRRNCL